MVAAAAILFALAVTLRARRPRAGAPDPALLAAELRVALETRLGEVGDLITRRVHASVEDGMRASFGRVTEQFAAVQTALGEMQASTARLADLRRLFGSVRARGAWGERQLRALLDDVLPAGGYAVNARVRPDSADTVEFAIRMPVAPGGGADATLLPIDAKFPTESYERLLAADDAGDADAARAARRALETAIRAEARRIGSKYVAPPATVDYAVLYLPTDGLYVEVARLPGVIDEIARRDRVMVLGPSLLPGLLRSIQLGHVTLALGAKAEQIGRTLAAATTDLARLDAALERLGRAAGANATALDEARRAARALGRRLAQEGREDTPETE